MSTSVDHSWEFEEEENLINQELQKMKRLHSWRSSENNSLMGDTPSNYNEANLRFNQLDNTMAKLNQSD